MSTNSNLSEECRLALGDLIIAFNVIESCARDFIGYLLKINNIQTEIVTYMDHLPVLLNRLYALYEIEVWDEKRQKRLSKIVEKLQGCNNKRCEYIHGEWLIGFSSFLGNDKPMFSKAEINKRFKTNPPESTSPRYVHPLEISELISELYLGEHELREIKAELKSFRHMDTPPDFLVKWPNEDEVIGK
jgi:hypothetical protein